MRDSTPWLPWLLVAGAIAGAAAEYGAEGSFDRTIKVQDAAELEVRTGSGRIEVRAGSPGSIRIHGTMKARDWFGGRSDAEEAIRRLEANPPIEQTGNLIRVGRRSHDGRENRVQISYEITAPPGTRVSAQSGSGSVRIEGLGGSVHAHTGSGRIEIAGMKGALRARTGSGRITVDGDPAGDWHLHTGSGRVTCDHPITVRGSIGRKSVSGRVRAGGPLIEMSSGSGSIYIE